MPMKAPRLYIRPRNEPLEVNDALGRVTNDIESKMNGRAVATPLTPALCIPSRIPAGLQITASRPGAAHK
jgi:hypothetical protein